MYILHYIYWDAVRWLLPLTLPGRTSSCTYICTLKCTFKGTESGPATYRTRPYGPSVHSTRAAACTFKCTFKGSCFEVVPQVRLVMWPRRSHSSLRRTHRLACGQWGNQILYLRKFPWISNYIYYIYYMAAYLAYQLPYIPTYNYWDTAALQAYV